MTIGDSIRYHRKRLNLTQTQLAERLNVTAQAVSRWENDIGLPDITMAVPLARALGTTTDELLRFGERYQEFEKRWKETLRTYGDNPEALLPVSLAALKEFPYDKSFLFRTAINQERIAELTEDDAQSSYYIGQAVVHARVYFEMDPDSLTAAAYYKRLKDKVTYNEQGECVLKSRYHKSI